MLIDSLTFENSFPMTYWLNLYTFYLLAIELKHNNTKIKDVGLYEPTTEITKAIDKSSRKRKFLSIFRKS